jgi:hypothetical protein
MKMNAMKLAIPLFVALAYGPAQGLAAPILTPTLESFAVLGASDVTSASVSTIGGNLGSSPTAPTAPASSFTFLSGGYQPGTQAQAQLDLDAAILTANAGAGTPLLPALTGTITPGTYNIGAGTLAGALILDGGGSNTAFWDFRGTSLTTSTVSSVTVQNIGNGAGVGLYWDIAGLATLNGPTFAGNVLAGTITTDGSLTMSCGRLLAATANVVLSGTGNTISTGCSGLNSNGFDQAPVAAVPEPETYAMMLSGLGLMGWVARRRKQHAA